MAQKIGDAFIELRAKFDKLNSDLKKGFGKVDGAAKKSTQKIGGYFKGLGGAIAGAFAAEAILRFANDAVKLGQELVGVRAAFERLGDPALLQSLVSATGGTVTNLKLMANAVQAKNLGVPIENLATLFEFASQRATDTGESVDKLVANITTGIGRKSVLVLDNLGISATQLRNELGDVSMEMASVGDVAAAVERIAQRSLSEIGSGAATAASELTAMQVKLENQKAVLGETLIPVWLFFYETVNDVVSSISTLFNSDASFFDRLKSYAELLIPGLRQTQDGFISLKNAIFGTGEVVSTVEEIDQSVKTLSASAAESARTFDFVSGTWSEAWAEFKVGVDNAVVGMETFDEYFEKESGVKYFNGLTGQWENVAKKIETATSKAKEFNEAAFDIAGANNQDNSGRRDFGGGDIEAVPEFLEEGIFEDFDENLRKGAEAQALLNAQLQIGQDYALGFGQALTNSLASALEGSGNFFQMMGQYLLQLAIQLAAAAAAALALNVLLPGIGGVAGANVLKSLGGFSGLFGQFSGQGGSGGFGGSKIFGRDIELSNSRTNTFNSRTTGIGG